MVQNRSTDFFSAAVESPTLSSYEGLTISSQFLDEKNSSIVMSEDGEMTTAQTRIRLSVLGAKGVGKTAIIVRYLTRRFIGEYRSQIDITYRHRTSVCNQVKQIEIIDFSSKNGEDLMPDLGTQLSDCFLVVFGIDDRLSFLKAVNIVSVLRSICSSENAPVTLLGNKNDLEHSRQVSFEELQSIASLFRCNCAEVSVAESREDIIPIISALLEAVSVTSEDSFAENHSGITFADESHNVSDFTPDSAPLIAQPSGDSSCGRTRDLSLESRTNQSAFRTSTINSDDDPNKNSDICQICSLNHEKLPLPGSSFLSKRKTSNGSPRSNLKRKADNSPPLRSLSLNYNDLRRKYDANALSLKAHNESGTCLGLTSLSGNEAPSEPTIKKDSKLSSFLSCSKAEKDKGSLSVYREKGSSPKTETTSPLASLLHRARSFTNENTDADHSKLASFKTASRSRKTLPSRILSSETITKYPESKTKTLPFDAPRPLPKKTLRVNISAPVEDFKNTSMRDPVEDNLSGFMKKKSFNSLEFSTGKKTGKACLQNFVTQLHKPQQTIIPASPDKRDRKFGVFGIGVLGNVFSKTSLPDLPKATASLYTKFGSIRNSIKKRSV